MGLLPNDIQYLTEREYEYSIHEEENQTLLSIKNYPLSEVFDRNSTNVLIKIPKGYPISAIDMFWVNPHIKLKVTGSYPSQADVFESSQGAQWQRFSRHYQWKPIYNIATHMNVIKDILLCGKG
ncbi:MAG: E2/UBC family protein [Ruminiclostridium sp.]|nr:E2/UBC family protein [Ruminiclostridium sp.]